MMLTQAVLGMVFWGHAAAAWTIPYLVAIEPLPLPTAPGYEADGRLLRLSEGTKGDATL